MATDIIGYNATEEIRIRRDEREKVLRELLEDLRNPTHQTLETYWKASGKETHADEAVVALRCVAVVIAKEKGIG